MAQAKESQKRRFREFKEFVFDQLQDPEFALAYLNESLKEDDQESFLVSLASSSKCIKRLPIKPNEVSSGKALQAKKK